MNNPRFRSYNNHAAKNKTRRVFAVFGIIAVTDGGGEILVEIAEASDNAAKGAPVVTGAEAPWPENGWGFIGSLRCF